MHLINKPVRKAMKLGGKIATKISRPNVKMGPYDKALKAKLK